MYILLQSADFLYLQIAIGEIERLQNELELLLKKQEALKQGAAYHGQLIKIKEYTLRKVLCVDTENDKLYSAITELEQQKLEEYKNSSEYPKHYWADFGDPNNEFRMYWISQWKSYEHYQTYLNRSLGE